MIETYSGNRPLYKKTPVRSRRQNTEYVSGEDNSIEIGSGSDYDKHSKASHSDMYSFPINVPQNQGIRPSKIKLNPFKNISEKFLVPIAICLWYLLGVISISTTKLLLREYGGKEVTITTLSPLILTFQQFCIGILFLGIISRDNSGNAIEAIEVTTQKSNKIRFKSKPYTTFPVAFYQSIRSQVYTNCSNTTWYLILSSLFFTLGFYTTNLSFSLSHASFVETIKASEPVSSAGTAVMWKLEVLSAGEVGCLICICVGVVISTLGNSKGGAHNTNNFGISELKSTEALISTRLLLSQSSYASSIVLVSNFCFSFRGLYQKLFRASPHGSKIQVTDLNLQYRMQLLGVSVLGLILFITKGHDLLKILWLGDLNKLNSGQYSFWIVCRYIMLAFVNGFAFTSYNLASTYVLTRVSVVNHAALNCIRRLFAIVVTSILFGDSLSVVSIVGIGTSIGGFISYTYFKNRRLFRPQSSSNLLPLKV